MGIVIKHVYKKYRKIYCFKVLKDVKFLLDCAKVLIILSDGVIWAMWSNH